MRAKILLKPLLWGGRPKCDVIVRFAPSPTGFMHLGNLRTAFYNYLFAKNHKGKFLLRFEDTDKRREKKETICDIIDVLKWVGLNPDEGPIFQSNRLATYEQYCNILLHSDNAYRCFCSPERIEKIREGGLIRYDGHCSNLPKEVINDNLQRGVPHTIRFRVKNQPVTFDDLAFGRIINNPAKVEGDFIIMRADKWPTYHLACVVDDHLMNVTHVFRGLEWQASTCKHIQMYRAFGWTTPVYCHLPIITENGKKLSKREGAKEIREFKAMGILPEALLTFLTFSGGGFSGETKGQTIDKLIEMFNPQLLANHNASLDTNLLYSENRFFLSKYIESDEKRQYLVKKLQEEVVRQFSLTVDKAYAEKVLNWSKGRISLLSDLVSKKSFHFLWVRPLVDLEITDETRDILRKVLDKFSKETNVNLLSVIHEIIPDGFENILKCIRIITTGCTEGPPISQIISVLSKEEFVLRILSFL